MKGVSTSCYRLTQNGLDSIQMISNRLPIYPKDGCSGAGVAACVEIGTERST